MIDNLEVYDSKQIASEMGRYFSEIEKTYANKIDKPETCINDYVSKIKQNERSMFLHPTNESEIKRLINKLVNNKAVAMMISAITCFNKFLRNC